MVLRAGILCATLVAVAGCAAPRTYHCTDDAQCVLGTVPGRCETDGFCSFPDIMCASGARYGEHAPAGIRHVCVGQPVNDLCERADPLELGVVTSGQLRGASASGVLTCSPQSTGDVFYTLDLAECSNVNVRAEASGGNLGVALLSGCDNVLACADDHQSSEAEVLTASGVPAGTYQVAIGGVFFDQSFTFSADIDPAPANDTFATAIPIVTGPHSLARANDDIALAGRTGGRDLFYTLPLQHSDPTMRWVVDIDVRGHEASDFVIALLDSAGNVIAIDAAGTAPVRIHDLPSGDYIVAVDGPPDGSCGSFDLDVTPRPVEANNRCTSAQTLAFGPIPVSVFGDLRDATAEYEGSCGGSGNDLVYEFQVIGRTHLRLSVVEQSGGFTPVVYVRKVAASRDPACSTTAQHAYQTFGSCDPTVVNPDVFATSAPACATGPSTATLDMESIEAGYYQVIVDSDDGAGRFALTAQTRVPLAEDRPGITIPGMCIGGPVLDQGCCTVGSSIGAANDGGTCGTYGDTFHLVPVPATCSIQGVVSVSALTPHTVEISYVGACTGTKPACVAAPATPDGDGVYRTGVPVVVTAGSGSCQIEVRVLATGAAIDDRGFYVVRYVDTELAACMF